MNIRHLIKQLMPLSLAQRYMASKLDMMRIVSSLMRNQNLKPLFLYKALAIPDQEH